MKRMIALVLALSMVFSLAACSGRTEADNQASSVSTESAASTQHATESEKPVEAEPIKIGHIVDLTGTQAMTGTEAKRALQFAVDSLGGQIAGRPVEIIVGDAAGDTQTAVDQAVKMVEQDKVVAIFGPTQPGQKTAVAEYMTTAEIPLIFYNATPDALISGNEWLVGAGGATAQLPTVMADYAYNELGYRTVNTASMDNVGFRSFVDSFVGAFEARGGTIVDQVWAPIPCADWLPYFTALHDADAIVAWASGSDAISLWSAWYDMGISKKMPMIAPHHGGFTDYFVPAALSNSNREAAEAMLGALAPMLYTYDIDSPENQKFVEAWTAEFGSVPANNLPGSCYQAVLLLNAAIEALDGETTADKLIEAMFEVDITGPEGHLSFEDGAHTATKDVYITQVVQMEDGSYNNSVITVYKDVPPSGLAQ